MEDVVRFPQAVERHERWSDGTIDLASSGVSWAAVIGGAFVAAAISLIMLALGAGFGLSVVSPWSNTGATAKALGVGAIAWLIVTEVVSCALGGYLTGRLRTKWVSVHTDEVHFRDTANGLLAWAVAVVMSATVLVSAASVFAGGTAPEASKTSLDPRAYYVDRLFRSEGPGAATVDAGVQAEASRILATALKERDSKADQAYLAHVVSVRTGLAQSDAERRVSQVLLDASVAEDAARSAAARILLWLFITLLMGAFCASFAATVGGRQRDEVRPS